MVTRLNVEAFQIRVNTHRLTASRGLAVTHYGNSEYIDPQIEPGFWTSAEPAKLESLRLRLSAAWPAHDRGQVLRQFSLHPGILAAKTSAEFSRFRVHPAEVRPIGRIALVSVIDHDTTSLDRPPFGLRRAEGSARLQHYQVVDNAHGQKNYGPHVGLALLNEGDHISVWHESGSYFSDVEQVTYRYRPDLPDGLVIESQGEPESPISPIEGDGGMTSGDREPRWPINPLSGNAVALEVPVITPEAGKR